MIVEANVFDIDWDTEDEDFDEDRDQKDLGLPSRVNHVQVEIENNVKEGIDRDELEERLCDEVSDQYGFLINSLDYSIKEVH